MSVGLSVCCSVGQKIKKNAIMSVSGLRMKYLSKVLCKYASTSYGLKIRTRTRTRTRMKTRRGRGDTEKVK